ncbi:MAG: hypothetical protein RLN83_00725 [Balneola sp.]
MSLLANTNWSLTITDNPDTMTIKFGPSMGPPGTSGGMCTIEEDSPSGNTSTPYVWVEQGNNFMLQAQNQNPGYSSLTTYSGTLTNGTGEGWFTNFLINFSNLSFSIKKIG